MVAVQQKLKVMLRNQISAFPFLKLCIVWLYIAEYVSIYWRNASQYSRKCEGCIHISMKSDLLIGCDQIQTINQERQFFEVQGHPRREGLPGTEPHSSGVDCIPLWSTFS
jgi:hypothetical protein